MSTTGVVVKTRNYANVGKIMPKSHLMNVSPKTNLTSKRLTSSLVFVKPTASMKVRYVIVASTSGLRTLAIS